MVLPGSVSPGLVLADCASTASSGAEPPSHGLALGPCRAHGNAAEAHVPSTGGVLPHVGTGSPQRENEKQIVR